MRERIRALLGRLDLEWTLHPLLAVLVCAPASLQPFHRLIGDPRVDVWNHAWGYWWFGHALSQGELPLHTQLLNAPAGGWLWFIDPIGAIAGMGLVPVFGLAFAWNAVMVALVAAASVAGRDLARAFGASERASWIGAVGVGASAHLISELHNGISEAVGVAWGVFAFAALVRAIDAPAELRRWVRVGLLGGLTVFGTYYYALGLFLAAVPLVIAALTQAPRGPLLRGLAVGAGVALLIAVPTAMVVQFTVAVPETSIIARPSGDWRERTWALRHNAVDPLSFLVPGDFQSVDLSEVGESFRHTSYLGWFVLVPAVHSRRWRLLACAAVPLVLSLGPFLWVGGGWVEVGGNLLALPYRLLLEVLPSGAIAHPQRVGFIGMAIVAAVGAAAVRERAAPWVAAGLLVELLLVSPAPWPVARTPRLDTGHAQAIATSYSPTAGPPKAVVVDVPAQAGGMSTSRYLYYQTLHRHPIPYGPNVREDGFHMFWNTALTALVLGDETQFRKACASEMRRGDAGWIALHTDLAPDGVALGWLESCLGPGTAYGSVLLWDIRPVDTGPAGPAPSAPFNPAAPGAPAPAAAPAAPAAGGPPAPYNPAVPAAPFNPAATGAAPAAPAAPN